jgi:ribosome-binding ATPase YchF (GTP1/OBG family)
MGTTEEEGLRLRGYALLSGKPMLLVANLGEAEIREAAAFLQRSGLAAFARKPGIALCAVSAPIEAEMAELSPEDAKAFRDDLSLAEPGLERVIRSTYDLLGLISFLTAGEDECRAWTIRRGTRAQIAAGTIHSDIERGFIRAEVIHWDQLLEVQTYAEARKRGQLRSEGKAYLVQDGDVLNILFNV